MLSYAAKDISLKLALKKIFPLRTEVRIHCVAQSCSFFFKRILPAAYIVPSNLYPKKQFILPNIMSEEEVIQLFAAPLTLKEYCVIGLLYGGGLRISEACNLRLKDIESHNKRLKVYQACPVNSGARALKTDIHFYLINCCNNYGYFMLKKDVQKNIYLPVSKPNEPFTCEVCR